MASTPYGEQYFRTVALLGEDKRDECIALARQKFTDANAAPILPHRELDPHRARVRQLVGGGVVPAPGGPSVVCLHCRIETGSLASLYNND